MNKLSYEEAVQLLNHGAVIYVLENGEPVYFGLRNQRIVVKAVNYSAHLQREDWMELYRNSIFYLYEPDDEELIDPKKDEEYYSWRHK